jgi:hypothetical protein
MRKNAVIPYSQYFELRKIDFYLASGIFISVLILWYFLAGINGANFSLYAIVMPFYNNFPGALREQFLFISAILYFANRIEFLIAGILSLLYLVSFHIDRSFFQYLLLVVFFSLTWIISSSSKNIWVTVLLHTTYNVAGPVSVFFIRPSVFMLLFAYAFGTRQYNLQSLAILRLVFPFKFGRAVLALLLWIFQTPQDLWRKYVRRELEFDYGARVIMNALANDRIENPLWGKLSLSDTQ